MNFEPCHDCCALRAAITVGPNGYASAPIAWYQKRGPARGSAAAVLWVSDPPQPEHVSRPRVSDGHARSGFPTAVGGRVETTQM